MAGSESKDKNFAVGNTLSLKVIKVYVVRVTGDGACDLAVAVCWSPLDAEVVENSEVEKGMEVEIVEKLALKLPGSDKVIVLEGGRPIDVHDCTAEKERLLEEVRAGLSPLQLRLLEGTTE